MAELRAETKGLTGGVREFRRTGANGKAPSAS